MRSESIGFSAHAGANERLRPDQIDPVEIYAAAIDTSDYVSQIAPVVLRHVGSAGHLLDIGAGGGQLGAALNPRHWTAVEPNPNMRARLSRFSPAPHSMACGWDEAPLANSSFDTVLAATMPAIMQEPARFLARCLEWSRAGVVRVVPAHRGPRGLVLAGCLPREWHNEDETPGIDITMAGLKGCLQPQTEYVSWTFSSVTNDLDATAQFLCGRLKWPSDDKRCRDLRDHLSTKAKPVSGGYRLDIPRRSAILVWG